MKKITYVIFSSLILFALAGCQEVNNEISEGNSTKETSIVDESLKDEDKKDVIDAENELVDISEPEQVEENQEILYQLHPDRWSLKPLKDDINDQVVLLTIDDAPEDQALNMAKTLKKLDAPAIFFVNGHFLETKEEQEQLREIYEMGFAIGNHTYYHQKLSDVGEDKQKQEILQLNDLIEEIIDEKPVFFRAPHGDNTDYVKELVEEQGMLLMNWTYGYDYFEPYMDADKLKEAMISGEGPEAGVDYSLLKPGAILLMHDRDWTAEALEDIVKGLREQGYEFVEPETIQITE
ncbi:polysaccharide deacetylase family protein [Gracilibacillus sp. S3-1-1]|uniref:Polysaccharide deacetylase family protein n=1 Tax=Gracilibacillus pellucidus TaxID=3095368 RepID=A0ACC6M1Z0_9BACI|nr:polysaccharide deacetylase family protein [Gracilibacillus sp. S3-1-1]MDX8044882.1 polysaccharide deacetylase family protein [Gracilibacillus sp. S3-1-1]